MLKASKIWKKYVKASEVPFKTWITVEKVHYTELQPDGSFDEWIDKKYATNKEFAWVNADGNGEPTTEVKEQHKSIISDVNRGLYQFVEGTTELVKNTETKIKTALKDNSNTKILGMNKKVFYIGLGIGLTILGVKIYKHYNK